MWNIECPLSQDMVKVVFICNIITLQRVLFLCVLTFCLIGHLFTIVKLQARI